MAEEMTMTFTLSKKEVLELYGEMYDHSPNVKLSVAAIAVLLGAAFGFSFLLFDLDRAPTAFGAALGSVAAWFQLRRSYGKSVAKQILKLQPGLAKEQTVRLADKVYNFDDDYTLTVGWTSVQTGRLLRVGVGLTFNGANVVIPDRSIPGGVDNLLEFLRNKNVEIL